MWTARCSQLNFAIYRHAALRRTCGLTSREAIDTLLAILRPHDRLGTLVESQAELEELMARCPKAGLIFDTARLAAADGDCLAIVRQYAGRMAAVHLKDWLVTDPDVGLDRWPQRGRFCELGAGNIGLDNAAVMHALVEGGYDGWVFVEHDTHLQDPLEDLAISRQCLRDAGF